MQRILFLCAVLTFGSAVFCQNSFNRPLKIGDVLPSVPFGKLYSGDPKSISLANLNGKLLILDFWNVRCVSCLKSMPTMDSLQKQFKDKIQVILITQNSAQQVEALFKKIKLKKLDIPIVVEDTLHYNELFPHEGDPMHVWVGTDGRIKAITDSYNATVSNIIKMLGGEATKLRVNPGRKQFVHTRSLLQNSNEAVVNSINAYSMFFPSLDEWTGVHNLRLVRDSTNGRLLGITMINYRLLHLYSLAYAKDLSEDDTNATSLIRNHRLKVEVADSLSLRENKVDSLYNIWMKKNLVSYEMRMPEITGEDWRRIVQDDLERFTPFTAQIEERPVECFVLTRVGNDSQLKPVSSAALPFSRLDSNYQIVNQKLSNSLLPQLISVYQEHGRPFLDETNYNIPVDMVLQGSLQDLPNVQKQLAWYGLKLSLETRLLRLLVIKDKEK